MPAITPALQTTRLFLARQHLDIAPSAFLRLFDEVLAVLGLARGGGGDGVDVPGTDLASESAKAPQRPQGTRHALLVEKPGRTTPRPRPHSIFSLKTGVGARRNPS